MPKKLYQPCMKGNYFVKTFLYDNPEAVFTRIPKRPRKLPLQIHLTVNTKYYNAT